MLYMIVSSLIMLAILDRAARIGRLENKKLETQFRLYALRDQLRRRAIDGEVSYNNWFDYLDTTLTTTVIVIDAITIWGALVFRYRHGNDPKILRAKENLRIALQQEENRPIAEIYSQYQACITEFLRERHTPLVVSLARRFGRSKKGGALKRDIVPTFSVVPETSTLMTHGTEPSLQNHVSGDLVVPA